MASTHRAIAPYGIEEDEDGLVFGVEGHEGAISDQFVGANEFSGQARDNFYVRDCAEWDRDASRRVGPAERSHSILFQEADVRRHTVAEHHGAWGTLLFRRHCG